MSNTEPKLLNRLKEETVPRDRYTLEGRGHDNRLCMERKITDGWRLSING